MYFSVPLTIKSVLFKNLKKKKKAFGIQCYLTINAAGEDTISFYLLFFPISYYSQSKISRPL